MSSSDHLAILSTLVLSNDVRVVETTASLILKLIQFNISANSKLYLSGVFFFACRYSGNNFLTLAKLLEVSHLCQATHMVDSHVGKELKPAQQSVLASILPTALISILITYGAEKFADVFTGEFDDPEVIWNNDFRKHVVELIEQHLGVYPARLRQYTLHKYEYIPIPTIHFPQLEKELFVNQYYL